MVNKHTLLPRGPVCGFTTDRAFDADATYLITLEETAYEEDTAYDAVKNDPEAYGYTDNMINSLKQKGVMMHLCQQNQMDLRVVIHNTEDLSHLPKPYFV